METLLPYLFVGAVIGTLIAWSWHFHFWSNSPTARRSRTRLWLGFTAMATSALLVIAGLTGLNLSKHSRFLSGSRWADGVIWWEVAAGLVLVPVAVYLLRRGVRDIEGKLGRV